jgi:hypothetical protein
MKRINKEKSKVFLQGMGTTILINLVVSAYFFITRKTVLTMSVLLIYMGVVVFLVAPAFGFFNLFLHLMVLPNNFQSREKKKLLNIKNK